MRYGNCIAKIEYIEKVSQTAQPRNIEKLMGIEEEGMDIKGVAMQLDKSYSTVNRWLHEGVVNRQTNERIYLRYEQDGGRLVIKREWVSEFVKALQPAR